MPRPFNLPVLLPVPRTEDPNEDGRATPSLLPLSSRSLPRISGDTPFERDLGSRGIQLGAAARRGASERVKRAG